MGNHPSTRQPSLTGNWHQPHNRTTDRAAHRSGWSRTQALDQHPCGSSPAIPNPAGMPGAAYYVEVFSRLLPHGQSVRRSWPDAEARTDAVAPGPGGRRTATDERDQDAGLVAILALAAITRPPLPKATRERPLGTR